MVENVKTKFDLLSHKRDLNKFRTSHALMDKCSTGKTPLIHSPIPFWSTHRGWMHIVYYTSVDHNPLTPLLRFVVNLS